MTWLLYSYLVSRNYRIHLLVLNFFWGGGYIPWNFIYNQTICKEEQFDFFLSNWWAFFSFSNPNALTRISNVMLIKSGKRGHACFVSHLGKAFSISSLTIMLSVSFCSCSFNILRQFPLIPIFWSVFIVNEWGIFFKCFYCTDWYNHEIVPQPINTVDRNDWYLNSEPVWHPWNKLQLVRVYNPFYILRNSNIF